MNNGSVIAAEGVHSMADTVKQGAGLRNVVAGESSLSWIDGERGILTYRGIDIHSLAEQSTFEEVVFLLHRGRLPARAELAAFAQELARERAVPAATTALLKLLPPVTHPMTSLRTAVSALGGLDPDANDDTPPANVRKALRLTGQMATIVALVDRLRKGRAPVAPDPSLSHAANFLHAVYRTEDPRTTHRRRMSRQLGEDNCDRRSIDLSERLAALVRAQKGLNANVDFYSTSVYHSLGIPTDMFTPVVAVSRIA